MWHPALHLMALIAALVLVGPGVARAQEHAQDGSSERSRMTSHNGFDTLEANYAERSPEGIITASGGVQLHITSLVQNGEVLISADRVVFNEQTGEAELFGPCLITLVGTSFSIECSYCHYDPVAGELLVDGLKIAVPLDLLLPPDAMISNQPRASLGGSLIAQIPEEAYFATGQARFDFSGEDTAIVLTDSMITHMQHPNPDLFVHCDELIYTPGKQVILRGVSLNMSGIELFAWPQFTRRLDGEDMPYRLTFPDVSYSSDVGLAWRQGLNVEVDALAIDTIWDYSPDYGMRVSGFGYFQPLPGAELGVRHGKRTIKDVSRETVERHDEYVVAYRQLIKDDTDWFSRMILEAEYGEVSAHWQPINEPLQYMRETRLFADAQVEFATVQLSNNLFLTSGARGRFVDYHDADETYTVIGGETGLILREGGFDHFILYRSNQTSGKPLFTFDELRNQEIDFAVSFRLHPEWHHVVRSIYDLEGDEFDMLQVGAMKRQRTYEIGAYWDFARESAGIELSLRTN